MSDHKNRVDAVVKNMVQIARTEMHEHTTVDHLGLALIADPELASAIEEMGSSPCKIESMLVELLASYPKIRTSDRVYPTERVEDVFRMAKAHASISTEEMSPETILLAMLTVDTQTGAYYVYVSNGITKETVTAFLTKKHKTKSAANLLEEFCVNLNEESSSGKIDPVIGRETEIQDTIEILSRRRKNNVIYVGKEGVGKTALAEGLARMIVNKEVPKSLQNKVVYSMDIGSMLAGTKYRGEFEERMKNILKEIKKKGNVILFIDEIHMIMGAGSSSGNNVDASNMLKPMLAKGELSCIGATTYDEFSSHFEKDRALMRRFQKMDVEPTSIQNTKKIVNSLKKYYEQFHGITYADGTIDLAVDLADRYIKSRYFPDKAIDIIDFAGAKAKLDGNDVVDIKLIMERVSKISRVPLDMIDVEEVSTISNMENKLKSKVFGQDDAITQIVDGITISKAGLRDKNKPIGSYLFLGPTGVGKTFLCKKLADTMGVKLVRFDMSEYQEKHSISRLIGAPPGYVGYGEGESGSGQLINEIEKNPTCVLLLDEVEKAASEIMTVLLQVMDDGRLTSNTGKTVDFSNVVLIMTSNLGASMSEKKSIGFNNTTNDSAVDEEVKRFFAPEFRNRLDSIVKFNRLTEKEMTLIITSSIRDLRDQMNKDDIKIDVSRDARKWLVKNGFDPAYGARPLARIFQDKVKKPLSKELLFGGLRNGKGKATIDVLDDDIVVTVISDGEKSEV